MNNTVLWLPRTHGLGMRHILKEKEARALWNSTGTFCCTKLWQSEEAQTGNDLFLRGGREIDTKQDRLCCHGDVGTAPQWTNSAGREELLRVSQQKGQYSTQVQRWEIPKFFWEKKKVKKNEAWVDRHWMPKPITYYICKLLLWEKSLSTWYPTMRIQLISRRLQDSMRWAICLLALATFLNLCTHTGADGGMRAGLRNNLGNAHIWLSSSWWPITDSFMKRGFILAHGLRVNSILVEKAWTQDPVHGQGSKLWDYCSHLGKSGSRERRTLALVFPFSFSLGWKSAAHI